ncbi:MAG: type II toxin-antitoxin system VapC family toxin [Chloroflexota bacterium]
MILDSSVIIAILLKESGFESVLLKIIESDEVSIGSPTLVECTIVLSARLQKDARTLIMRFLQETNISIVPFTQNHYSVAVSAWLNYGKGRHPAALNFGDCLAYATAKIANQPLLMKGEDFNKTDIILA